MESGEADGTGAARGAGDDVVVAGGFVGSAEAAAIVAVSRDVFYGYVRAGRVPAGTWALRPCGSGRERVYPVEVVRRFADEVGVPFPPPGTVGRDEAARRLGVAAGELKYLQARGRLAGGRLVKLAGSRARVVVFPIADVERLAEELRTAAAAAVPSAGFVGRVEAARILGITRRAFGHWVRDGKLGFGVTVPSKVGGRRRLYSAEALRALRAEMLGRDTLFKGAAGSFAVPAGWTRRREACQMFGVGKTTWQAWAGDGHLPAGERFDGGPTVYRVEELKRMLERLGVLAPPYADPDRAGAVRVPLCGGDVRGAGGREAVVDAETLALLDGAVLTWESVEGGRSAFVGLRSPEKPAGVALRRAILALTDDGLNVSHANGDPLDCRRANLVVKTIQERTRGTRKMRGIKGRPCSSRFKGVFWDAWAKRWRARIVVDGRTIPLGRSHDELAAAEAYDAAVRQYFGEHGWLNFPDGVDARLERDAIEAERRTAA